MDELQRRLVLWEGIRLIPTGLVEPKYLRENKIRIIKEEKIREEEQ